MSYFSRLTDIVTCNLTKLLNEADDPKAAIEEIIREMQEGVAGAKRSVTTAANSEARLAAEIEEHRQTVTSWANKAREQLLAKSEEAARESLLRKREVEGLIAGLEQQLRAATATKEQLATTQRALDARLSEALRRRDELWGGAVPANEAESANPLFVSKGTASVAQAEDDIDAELAALKRELSGN